MTDALYLAVLARLAVAYRRCDLILDLLQLGLAADVNSASLLSEAVLYRRFEERILATVTE